jgi:dihydrofolate synthase/folylpolyglutamate synthase
MEYLCRIAGNPEHSAPVIHIAGSKGKGSVTGMITAVMEAAGRRVARYMSPHVSDFRERISFGSAFFDEAVYCSAGDELRDIAESLNAEIGRPGADSKTEFFDPSAREDGEGPTYFELLTLYFFLCARKGNCDFIALETGVGGRLDSTNIVDPLASVITLIELEHTDFLGSTIGAIAGEKAGIIKPGKPLILAEQSPEALEVFRNKALEKRSPLVYFPETACLRDIRIHKGGTDFTLEFKKPGFFQNPLRLFLPIPGAVQAQNAGLAITALKTVCPELDEKTVRRGLEQFRIPARFELISQEPPLIIDGAHTPESVALCTETFCSLYGDGGILLFGCVAGKNAGAMTEILLPHFSRLIITTPGTFKVSEPEKVYDLFTAGLSQAARNKVIFIKDTPKAVEQALELGRCQNLPILGIGSFYLAAEIRAFCTQPALC